LNGDDLRREPLEVRKATLASVLVREHGGAVFLDVFVEAQPCMLCASRFGQSPQTVVTL
jgi:hypothetical protein